MFIFSINLLSCHTIQHTIQSSKHSSKFKIPCHIEHSKYEVDHLQATVNNNNSPIPKVDNCCDLFLSSPTHPEELQL